MKIKVLIGLLWAGSVFGQTCDITAFVIDKDPKGLNVRSAPNQEIISRIPYKNYKTDNPIKVHIIDTQEGWLQIDYWSDDVAKGDFDSPAWVYNQLLAVAVVGNEVLTISTNATADTPPKVANIYENPDPQAAVIGQLNMEKLLINPMSCQGKWILVEGNSIYGQPIKGWLSPDNQCIDSLKTCRQAQCVDFKDGCS